RPSTQKVARAVPRRWERAWLLPLSLPDRVYVCPRLERARRRKFALIQAERKTFLFACRQQSPAGADFSSLQIFREQLLRIPVRRCTRRRASLPLPPSLHRPAD